MSDTSAAPDGEGLLAGFLTKSEFCKEFKNFGTCRRPLAGVGNRAAAHRGGAENFVFPRRNSSVARRERSRIMRATQREGAPQPASAQFHSSSISPNKRSPKKTAHQGRLGPRWQSVLWSDWVWPV